MTPVRVSIKVSSNQTQFNLKVNQSQIQFPLKVHSNNIPVAVKLDTKIEMLSGDIYDGDYIVTPLANGEVILETKNKSLTDDVTVLKVPRFQTSNEYGTTFYIAEV